MSLTLFRFISFILANVKKTPLVTQLTILMPDSWECETIRFQTTRALLHSNY